MLKLFWKLWIPSILDFENIRSQSRKKTQKYRIRLAEKMFKFSIFRRFCEGRIGKPTKKKITYLI